MKFRRVILMTCLLLITGAFAAGVIRITDFETYIADFGIYGYILVFVKRQGAPCHSLNWKTKPRRSSLLNLMSEK